MASEMEQVLRGVALKCQVAVNADAVSRLALSMNKEPFISIHIERVLRESGLLRLLEAGQAMRDKYAGSSVANPLVLREWDAALAAMKEKVHA